MCTSNHDKDKDVALSLTSSSSKVSISNWTEIDWKVVNATVTRLRRRIYRASKHGNWNNLRSLQRLMVKSEANLLRSIRHVTQNSGKNTPGIDGSSKKLLIHLFEEGRIQVYNELKSFKWIHYNPIPVKRIYIPKPDGSSRRRPLGIPAIRDRILQMVIKNALPAEPQWEAKFESSSYGFRPARSVNDAINRIYVSLNKPNARCWIVDFFEGCFSMF